MGHYKPPLEGRSEKDYLLLDFSERTTGPSPEVKKALKDFIDLDRIQVYPEYGNLEEKIAEYAGVKNGRAMVTNGGDQGIDVICRSCLDEGDRVIIPFPSFAMHYQSSGIQGAEILEPRYGDDGSFPLEETLKMLEDEKVRLVILCNPNNPLGSPTSLEDVEKILKKAQEKDITVMHDEAYFEFSKITAKDFIDKYSNLYIIRTFAKAFGLVSARAGYVLSRENNIQELLKVRGPYDVNMFAKVAILAALKNKRYAEDYAKEVMEISKPKLEAYLRGKGVGFFPSRANYLFLRLADPTKLMEKLKAEKILTRPKEDPDRKISLRISIGTSEDTEKLISVLDKVLD